MWDSSFMANFDNLSEINENFSTIKTLLNSIRAQGILNTSDVDKLLSGINAKLEKINTEEDIDLIKIFLSELKQNLDERHNVLISKFGAIESLFSNLLKNSSEMPKSAELKELFDIVATNLSVFSREVVSQKDTLTDITLRIDALRSDDSQKKDIIKNITLLKPDLERLNNGFDSIVLSLNDNFKTIIKTIASFDKTDYFDRFADVLTGIEMSVNTSLSAIQVLDKKAEHVDNALQQMATKDDLAAARERLVELTAQNHELVASVDDLSNKYIKIDSLSEKIDASVNIIANLKSVLEDADNQNTNVILDRLKSLEAELTSISNDTKFEDFKTSLEGVLKNILDNTLSVDSIFAKKAQEISTEVNIAIQKLELLQDANITRILNDLSTSSDTLNIKLAQAQNSIASLCEKNFGSLFENIANVKTLISQIDENSVASNSAIFSNITDRLTVFENSLKTLMDTHEQTINLSSSKYLEQLENINNIAGIIDYKMDSSIVENNNIKRELESLTESINSILALDFVNTVKDLRVDLYASKQEIMDTVDSTNSELTEKFTNDLYSKYELLIRKLDAVEDVFKKTQAESLSSLKTVLENISASIMDVLTYVGEERALDDSGINDKLKDISEAVRESNLNYIDGFRNSIDEIRIQVENSLKSLEDKTSIDIDNIRKSISENSLDIKNDYRQLYSKFTEVINSYKEIKEILSMNNITSANKFDEVISSANGVRNEFESQLDEFKTSLLDKISEFKQIFTSNNSEKLTELRIEIENMQVKSSQEIADTLNGLRVLIKEFSTDDNNTKAASLAKILDSFVSLKDFMTTLNSEYTSALADKVDDILDDFNNVKSLLNNIDNNVDEDMTRQLSIIESNFESLVSQITILFDKSNSLLVNKIDSEFETISTVIQNSVAEKLESYKLKVEEIFNKIDTKTAEQTTFMQERISDINTAMKSVWEKQTEDNCKQIEEMSDSLKKVLDDNIELTSVNYNSFKENLVEFAKNIETNNTVLIQDLKTQLGDITKYIDSVLDIQSQEIIGRYEDLVKQNGNIITTQDSIIDKQNAISLQINSSSQDIVEKLNSAKSETLKTMAELSVVTAEQLENIKAETFNVVGEMKELGKTQFDALQTAHNDIICNINKQSLKAEENAESLKELRTIGEEHLNYSRLSQSDTLQAVDNIKSLVENQIELSKNAASNIDSLSQICISNNNLVTSLEESASERNEAAILRDENILQSVNRVESLTRNDIAELSKLAVANRTLLNNLDNSLINNVSALNKLTAEISAGELQTLDSYVSTLLEQIEDQKQNVKICKDLITEFTKKELDLISQNIEKETDIVMGELVEQFELLKQTQNDEIGMLVSRIEDIVSSHLYNNIEDLKSYLDIKTDTSILSGKLDSLKTDTTSYLEEIASQLSDFSEIKAKSTAQLDSLKAAIENTDNSISTELHQLNECFENLRNQISNKSFDEAFQASIDRQIQSLEGLINEQTSYLEDISELCADNLPEVAELNTLVKHSIIESLKDISTKFDLQDIDGTIETALTEFKTDIITQFLNIFNQISFVAEQEEILDFVNEKHDELITILSHIITSSDEIETVKDTVVSVEAKMDNLKEEIEQINEKITAIISAEGDVDYVYSLQDLESDIANLRIELNSMKENDHGQEFEDLINSTNNIYALVESIKTEIPNKSDFDEIAEDIVSISTRTNKLILASDESYKTLQDNLADFKLVINDLDERTKNFAQDSGMDKVNAKLNAINSMMEKGAKTNQVFNQVFEYLAEWVDSAGVQINSITDKMAPLGEIGQIKDMLAELKAGAEDNSETVELIDALGQVFDKQTKRISSLETKLDKIIVETTINNRNKIDLTPMEDTLNRFLVAIEDKMSSQQTKINSLEAKLEGILELLDGKETVQLTKKVGGMDRQIAKLNKSIEKIASYVVDR